MDYKKIYESLIKLFHRILDGYDPYNDEGLKEYVKTHE